MTGKQFTCGICDDVFESISTDAETAAEFEARFGHEMGAEEVGAVCEDCDKMIVNLLRNDPEFRAEAEALAGRPINLDARPAKVM
jgi:hypothetical protein